MKSNNPNEKTGVFISHSGDEKNAAIKFKSLLRNAFGKDLEVFISSDYRSIAGGDHWFETIIKALKSSKVILVMLSKHSIDRRWINFEAGVGKGSEARVIPILFRDCDKDRVGPPLSLLQLRDMKVMEDLKGILEDVGVCIGQLPRPVDLELFIEELSEIESVLPASRIEMVPTLEYSGGNTYLHFRLENKGNKEVQLTEVWATIPQDIRDTSSHLPSGSPALKVEYDNKAIPPTLTKRQFSGVAISGADYFASFEVLPTILVEGQFPYQLPEMRFVLKLPIVGNESLSFGTYGIDGANFRQSLKIKEVEGFKTA